ncbi:MAG: transglutaminase family protein, partial [Burkholderiales bacterium]
RSAYSFFTSPRMRTPRPGGRSYSTFPVNGLEAEARRVARFQPMGHTAGPMVLQKEGRNPGIPLTLDLRRKPQPGG